MADPNVYVDPADLVRALNDLNKRLMVIEKLMVRSAGGQTLTTADLLAEGFDHGRTSLLGPGAKVGPWAAIERAEKAIQALERGASVPSRQAADAAGFRPSKVPTSPGDGE